MSCCSNKKEKIGKKRIPPGLFLIIWSLIVGLIGILSLLFR